MGRLVLIVLVLFSVTAIYSEAHAGGQRNQAQETTGSPQWRNAGPGCPEARPLLRDRARLNG